MLIRDLLTSYFASFDGMSWPCPCQKMDDLQWRFRYQRDSITDSDMIGAAGIISAYWELIYKTQKRRNYICEQLKKAHKVKKEIDLEAILKDEANDAR